MVGCDIDSAQINISTYIANDISESRYAIAFFWSSAAKNISYKGERAKTFENLAMPAFRIYGKIFFTLHIYFTVHFIYLHMKHVCMYTCATYINSYTNNTLWFILKYLRALMKRQAKYCTSTPTVFIYSFASMCAHKQNHYWQRLVCMENILNPRVQRITNCTHIYEFCYNLI